MKIEIIAAQPVSEQIIKEWEIGLQVGSQTVAVRVIVDHSTGEVLKIIRMIPEQWCNISYRSKGKAYQEIRDHFKPDTTGF